MLAVELLAQKEARDIVEIMSSEAKMKNNPEIVEAFEEADKIKRPTDIILLLKELQILDIHEGAPWDKEAEIYVIAQMTSAVKDDKTKSYTTYTTQTFHGIKKDSFLQLGQNGMVLWAGDVSAKKGKDPKEFIDFHIAVMESDKKSRDIGSVLEKYKNKAKLDTLNDIISKLPSVGEMGAIISLASIIFDLIIVGLKNDGDDHVGSFHDTLLRQQGYAPGRWPREPEPPKRYGDIALAYNVIVSNS